MKQVEAYCREGKTWTIVTKSGRFCIHGGGRHPNFHCSLSDEPITDKSRIRLVEYDLKNRGQLTILKTGKGKDFQEFWTLRNGTPA